MASPRTQQLDVSRLSESDMKDLKEADPFMYRSIPAVYQATLALEPVDSLAVRSSRHPIKGGPIITRRTRLSTESHISLLLDDLLEMDDMELQQEASSILTGFDSLAR